MLTFKVQVHKIKLTLVLDLALSGWTTLVALGLKRDWLIVQAILLGLITATTMKTLVSDAYLLSVC